LSFERNHICLVCRLILFPNLSSRMILGQTRTFTASSTLSNAWGTEPAGSRAAVHNFFSSQNCIWGHWFPSVDTSRLKDPGGVTVYCAETPAQELGWVFMSGGEAVDTAASQVDSLGIYSFCVGDSIFFLNVKKMNKTTWVQMVHMSHEETVLPPPETISYPFTTRRQN